MKATAEAFIIGKPVKDAIITVPAHFDNGQQQATKGAGTIAGLNDFVSSMSPLQQPSRMDWTRN
jgi:molecular chaperone DnaK (HSP70)